MGSLMAVRSLKISISRV